MRTFEDIIDRKSAQIFQWTIAIGEELSEGKRREDQITHSAISNALKMTGAEYVTGIIADEGRLEGYLAAHNPAIKGLTLVTLRGDFEAAAKHTLQTMDPAIRAKVRVTADLDRVTVHSQDAVTMNMIGGCMADETNHTNLHQTFCLASAYLKPKGVLVLVRPNPEAGELSTYHCVTTRKDLEAGKDYRFMVDGLEQHGEMKNLYTPDDFIEKKLKLAGFKMGRTIELSDISSDGQPTQRAAFLMNICSKLAPGC